MENLLVVHRNSEPDREQSIAPLWRVDRPDGSSQYWTRWEIEANDTRRHPRDSEIERITVTHRTVERTR